MYLIMAIIELYNNAYNKMNEYAIKLCQIALFFEEDLSNYFNGSIEIYDKCKPFYELGVCELSSFSDELRNELENLINKKNYNEIINSIEN